MKFFVLEILLPASDSVGFSARGAEFPSREKAEAFVRRAPGATCPVIYTVVEVDETRPPTPRELWDLGRIEKSPRLQWTSWELDQLRKLVAMGWATETRVGWERRWALTEEGKKKLEEAGKE